MKTQGFLVGITGPPGIGKNYITNGIIRQNPTQFGYLYRYTTRDARPTDLDDGVVPVDDTYFTLIENELIGVHDPLGNGKRYGWRVGPEVMRELEEKILLTDPNISQLEPFRYHFGDKMHLIGLIGNTNYIKFNIKERYQSSGVPITEEILADITRRVEYSQTYNAQILLMHDEGVFNKIIEVGWHNRDSIVAEVQNEICRVRKMVEGNRTGIEGNIPISYRK